MAEAFFGAQWMDRFLPPGLHDYHLWPDGILERREYGYDTVMDRHMEDLRMENVKLLDVAYWTRLWIVQELALAKTAQIVSGTQLASAKWVLSCVDPYYVEGVAFGLRRAVSNLLLSADTPQGSEGQSRTLFDVAIQFSRHECDEPLDHVYALLGIADDADHFTIDYTARPSDIFYWFLSHYRPATLHYKGIEHLAKALKVTGSDFIRFSSSPELKATRPVLLSTAEWKRFRPCCPNLGHGNGIPPWAVLDETCTTLIYPVYRRPDEDQSDSDGAGAEDVAYCLDDWDLLDRRQCVFWCSQNSTAIAWVIGGIASVPDHWDWSGNLCLPIQQEHSRPSDQYRDNASENSSNTCDEHSDAVAVDGIIFTTALRGELARIKFSDACHLGVDVSYPAVAELYAYSQVTQEDLLRNQPTGLQLGSKRQVWHDVCTVEPAATATSE